jgi:predicted P-loop ATPase
MKKQKKDDAQKEHKRPWREVYATVEDIQNFLMDRVLLRHNVITRRVECREPGSMPPNLGGSWQTWQPISDRIVNSLWAELSATKAVRAQDLYRVIESDFVPEYNPFTFYLEHLPPWDGKDDYILELSLSVCVKGDEQTQWQFYEYLRKWLVAMVAGWVDASVVNNVILVLIGEQGSYKTTWFNYLLPPELKQYFYTKTNANRMGRDELLTLSQYALVCCEELDTMRPSELNQLKAAVTMPSIDERAAYAHYHEHREHIASFCGTGNNVQFLSDPTGNRRWLPFEVQNIMSPREHPFHYEGIYAQAYALYREGFPFWFSREEIMRLSEHNRQFETPRLEKELVGIYFRKPAPLEGGEFIPVGRALQLIGGNMVHELSAIRLGRAFTELGFELKHTKTGNYYRVVQRSAQEIQSLLRCIPEDG